MSRRSSSASAGKVIGAVGTFAVELPGVYDITVYAYDPASGNTGVDRLTLTVTGE